MGVELVESGSMAHVMDELCDVLVDCVEGGASVGFMSPYAREDALNYWKSVLPAVENGGTILFVARAEGRIVGTVQVGLAQFPNQPHRGDLKKLLVHSAARGRGLATALMNAAEREAFSRGKTLLVLDTATGSPAESLYRRLGWTSAGIIPDYALWPDGRYCATTYFYKHLSAVAA
jgi:ribosomal protein S18 acetylase RimI-like enzyme